LNIIQWIIISLTIFIFLFDGCVPSKPTEDVELLPSERLINKLEANRRKIKNFEGIGVFEIESDQYSNSANFQIVMQKPDSIYFSVLGPFGIELAQALVTKDDYVFYDALQNTAYIDIFAHNAHGTGGNIGTVGRDDQVRRRKPYTLERILAGSSLFQCGGLFHILDSLHSFSCPSHA